MLKILEGCRRDQHTISEKIGIRILQIATLDANAVQNREIIIHIDITRTECISPANAKDSPSILAIPLTLLPSAKANPPPVREIICN